MLLKPNYSEFKPRNENMNGKEYFGLLLQNQLSISDGGFCLDTTSNANAVYQVDFDALFQGRGKLYNKAQVRARLISDGEGQTPIENAIGTLSILGLPSVGLGTQGTYIMGLTPSPQTDAGDTTATGYYYNLSSMNNKNGTQVGVPSGIQVIRVQCRSVLGTILAPGNMPDYSLYLEFELYERK